MIVVRGAKQNLFPYVLFQPFQRRSGALHSPLVTRVTLGQSLTATAPLFSGAARVSAAQPCGKRKNGQTATRPLWPWLAV